MAAQKDQNPSRGSGGSQGLPKNTPERNPSDDLELQGTTEDGVDVSATHDENALEGEDILETFKGDRH